MLYIKINHLVKFDSQLETFFLLDFRYEILLSKTSISLKEKRKHLGKKIKNTWMFIICKDITCRDQNVVVDYQSQIFIKYILVNFDFSNNYKKT